MNELVFGSIERNSADHRANFLDGWEYAGAAFDWDALILS